MDKQDLIFRTKKFALNVIKICNQLPSGNAFNVFSKQLIRCSSSVGANYRAACRARSTADFISKLAIVEEEADETLFWLELIEEMKIVDNTLINSLMKENDELIAIIVSSIKTARKK